MDFISFRKSVLARNAARAEAARSPFEGSTSDADLLRRKNNRTKETEKMIDTAFGVFDAPAPSYIQNPPPRASVVNDGDGSDDVNSTRPACLVHQAITLGIAKTPIWFEEEERKDIEDEREKLIMGGGGRNLFNDTVEEEGEEEDEVVLEIIAVPPPQEEDIELEIIAIPTPQSISPPSDPVSTHPIHPHPHLLSLTSHWTTQSIEHVIASTQALREKEVEEGFTIASPLKKVTGHLEGGFERIRASHYRQRKVDVEENDGAAAIERHINDKAAFISTLPKLSIPVPATPSSRTRNLSGELGSNVRKAMEVRLDEEQSEQ